MAGFCSATLAGNYSGVDINAFIAAGYSERHVLGVILAISVKTISNYANHVFHTTVDPVFGHYEWREAAAA